MSIETALYTVLNSKAEVVALVSDRIYPLYLPQSPTFPAIAYRRNSTQPISLLANDTDILKARFEIAGFSKTYDQAQTLADEIRQALQRYKGTVSSMEILDITIENIDQAFEQDFEIYESSVDITITYRA